MLNNAFILQIRSPNPYNSNFIIRYQMCGPIDTEKTVVLGVLDDGTIYSAIDYSTNETSDEIIFVTPENRSIQKYILVGRYS